MPKSDIGMNWFQTWRKLVRWKNTEVSRCLRVRSKINYKREGTGPWRRQQRYRRKIHGDITDGESLSCVRDVEPRAVLAVTALSILNKEQGWNTPAEHIKGFYWPWHTDPTQKISKKSAITDVVIAGFMDKTCIFSWVKLTIIMRFVRLFILTNYKSNKKTRINCYIILRRHYIWSFNYTIIW